jgi:DNA-binding NarL/FixJ family response regulator
MTKIRVLLADDHAVVRAGLQRLIDAEPDMEIVDQAADTHTAAHKVREKNPDVLILDLSMPGGNSIRLIEQLRQECPRTRVLVLTMHDEPAYLHAVVAAGGCGYIVKTAPVAELLSAIRAVHAGRLVVDLTLREGVMQNPAGHEAVRAPKSDNGASQYLSQREREVVELLAQGHTSQKVADQLFVSVKTVETYRARIAEKLGLRSRADLVRYAEEVGLLAPGRLAASAAL